MSKHTPGPWKWNVNELHNDNETIAIVRLSSLTEDQANKALIAAAPDLLEAALLAISFALNHARRPETTEERNIRAQQSDAALVALQSAVQKARGQA